MGVTLWITNFWREYQSTVELHVKSRKAVDYYCIGQKISEKLFCGGPYNNGHYSNKVVLFLSTAFQTGISLMNKATKAALLSALVFPGAGHFLLKKYITGVVLGGASVAALYLLIAKAVEKALMISEKIQNGDVPLDVAVISELVKRQATGPDAQLINIATAILCLSWLLGIVDSYRVGCGQKEH